jgi:sulfur-oxidizing protein SoxZ
MSDVGKVRLRVPATIKAGDVIRVRCLVIHPMERIERDKQGKIIDRKYQYIDTVTVTYLGKTILTFDTTQSVSENPYFAFPVRATDPGTLTVTFHDTHGRTYEGSVDIKLS